MFFRVLLALKMAETESTGCSWTGPVSHLIAGLAEAAESVIRPEENPPSDVEIQPRLGLPRPSRCLPPI